MGLSTRWSAGVCFAATALVAGLLLAATEPGAQPSAAAPAAGQRSTRSSAASRKAPGSAVRRAARRRSAAPPPPPLVATTPFGASSLAADLSSLLRTRVKNGTWGVIVTSVTNGDTLFSHNADTPLRPASTQKLFTSVLAFERLGTSHQMSTDLLRTGPVEDGVLRGSLVLRGGGDPALSGRFLGGSPESPLVALAQMVANAGIKRIAGDIVGDASAFDGQKIPDGWLARYLDASYASRVSALSLNSNLLHVAISPTRSKKAALVTLRPALSGFKVVNQTRTSASGRGARLTVSRSGAATVVVKGWIGRSSGPRVYTVVVEDPARFVTAAFRQTLVDAGIKVDGNSRVEPAPAEAEEVAALSSPPLYQLIRVMNGESDNHFAELLLRDAARGHEVGTVGSVRLANEQLRALLAERAGVDPAAVSMADGSGLSSRNRVTARALTQLLSYANRAPWAREFHQSLPVAGVSETLRGRMQNTPAQGNLRAKTGTTNDVIALGGYVTSRSGELLAFSMLYNGHERYNARETIDAMAATLAGFTR